MWPTIIWLHINPDRCEVGELWPACSVSPVCPCKYKGCFLCLWSSLYLATTTWIELRVRAIDPYLILMYVWFYFEWYSKSSPSLLILSRLPRLLTCCFLNVSKEFEEWSSRMDAWFENGKLGIETQQSTFTKNGTAMNLGFVAKLKCSTATILDYNVAKACWAVSCRFCETKTLPVGQMWCNPRTQQSTRGKGK